MAQAMRTSPDKRSPLHSGGSQLDRTLMYLSPKSTPREHRWSTPASSRLQGLEQVIARARPSQWMARAMHTSWGMPQLGSQPQLAFSRVRLEAAPEFCHWTV